MALGDEYDSEVEWGTVLRNANNEFPCIPMSGLDRSILLTTNEKWYAGRITRNLAEIFVQRNNLPRGSFLIRERLTEINGKQFALTVNDVGGECGEKIKHYTIERDDVTGAFIISVKPFEFRFESLSKLVQHYSKQSDFLCCTLTYPALQIPSTPRRPIKIVNNIIHFVQNTTPQNSSNNDVQFAVKNAVEAVHTQIRTTVSCSICQQVSKEPTLCISCGQLVGCYTCVLTALNHDERCPLCRHAWSRANLTGFIKSRLSFDNISGL